MNGEDTSSLSSEEEKEGDAAPAVNGLAHSEAPPSSGRKADEEAAAAAEEDDDEEEEGSCLPTIFFSHTIEPKKVRGMNNLCSTECVFVSFGSALLTLVLPPVSPLCFR